MPEDFATKGELNGLGSRVSGAEIILAVQDEKIKTIQREAAEEKRDVWRAIGDFRNVEKSLIAKVSVIMGVISMIGMLGTVLIQVFLKG